MIEERLYINNTYIPLSSGLNPSINKAISDLENPDKRKTTFTKTISIPRSRESDKVFQHIWGINVRDLTFNPKAKTTCWYSVGDQYILNGYIKLNEIRFEGDSLFFYDCTIYSNTANFWLAIRDKMLTDLYASSGNYEGLDIFNHPYSRQLMVSTWDTEIYANGGLVPFDYGYGYVYPLIDYGLSTDATNFQYNHLPCAVYLKEYLQRGIAYAGFTYNSAWIDGTVCERLIIPESPLNYLLDSTEISNRQFVANTPEFLSTGTTTSANLPTSSYSSLDTIIFTNDSVAPGTDPGLNYDPVTGVFTCVYTGNYDINALCDLNATFTPGTGTAVKTRGDVEGFLSIQFAPYLSSTWTVIDQVQFFISKDDTLFTSGARSTSTTPTYPDNDYMDNALWSDYPYGSPVPRPESVPDRYQLTALNIPLNAGDKVKIQVKARFYRMTGTIGMGSPTNLTFVDSGGTYYTGNATISCSVGVFYNKLVNTLPVTGNQLTMDKVIPKNIKMIDFFSSVFKMFNLWVDINPANPFELIIKERDDYLTSDVKNIQELIDRDKEITHTLAGINEIRQFKYQYKQDNDYWNKQYLTSRGDGYGNRTIENENEFVSGEQKTEVIFSATPVVGLPGSDRVIPTIYDLTGANVPKSLKHNIRILYYGGLKSCSSVWNIIQPQYTWPYVPVPYPYTEYPYSGHWDDPFNPTLDINFGLVKEVYYDDNLQDITATDANLVNVYHSRQIRELTDNNTRIVKAYVHIRPAVFEEMTFDKLYWFDNAYFRLQSIEGYNPTSAESTLCVFLKYNNKNAFGSTGFPVDGNPQEFNPDFGGDNGNIDMGEGVPVKGTKSAIQSDGNNYITKSAVVNGTGNYVGIKTYGVEINGNYNQVTSGSKNVIINGDENIVSGSNVTLINTSGVTVEESNVTYIDGKKQDYWIEKTAAFLVDSTVVGYFLNGSSAIVQARLFNTPGDFIFKCTDDTNRVYIDASPYTIDGTSAEFDLLANESIRLRWCDDDQTYYITN
jgi:hypothetical protein